MAMATAEVDGVPTLGAELKDGFKLANAWAAQGIAWLDDIQQFYRERSAIEKEYSARLSGLARKHFDKKSKKSTVLSVGETPAMTPGSLESASLTTWSTQLTTLEKRADEHDRFANELVTQVAEPLKAMAVHLDDLRRRHADYADMLEKERDLSYLDLRKIKARYDTVCQEVESRRKKSESAFDKAKAQSAYQQQILEMNNVKNYYLIAIAVTNKLKEKYYHQYVPDLMDCLQDLTESRTAELNGLWAQAAQLEADLVRHGLGLIDNLSQEITRNQPHLDSMMYIRHNLDSWQEPADKAFEPSPVWHDDANVMVDDVAKVYLRNMLNKSKSQLGDLRRDVDRRRRELEHAMRVHQTSHPGSPPSDGANKKDNWETAKHVFALQQDLHQVDRKRVAAEMETMTIMAAVGDVTLGSRNHDFKAQTFKIPTNCDLCGERIWGLSAKGFDCRDCGYVCHSKCEMKVPAECPGEKSKEDRKRLKVERQEAANSLLKPSAVPEHVAELPALARTNTMNSLSSSGYATSAERRHSSTPPASDNPERPMQVRPAKSVRLSRLLSRALTPPTPQPAELPGTDGWPGEQKAKMLYQFEAKGPNELSLAVGKEVTMLEADDGTGWIKVRCGQEEGLVPTSYLVELPPPTAPASAGPGAVASARPDSIYSNSGSSIGTTGASVEPAKKRGPAVAPRRGARKLRYVETLYDYAALQDAEHSIEPGERLVLVGDDHGDGWVEVEKAGAAKRVPAAYVRVLSA